VVSDTAEPDAAPNLPEEALVRLGENLQRDLGRALPVAITAVISTDRIRPEMHGDWAQFAELGRLRGLDYLAVVVVSSAEQEYPVTLFLGLTTHAQPGFRRDNWSLLEFALLDLKHDQILMQAEGRGWATLDRPTVNKTGLAGRFDFTLDWAPDESQYGGELPKSAEDAAVPPLFTAVQEQLGLKLTATKGVVSAMVVDEAVRPVVD